MTQADESFYARLPEITRFRQVTEPRWYAPAPDSWLMAMTDVRGSTRAIEAGRYRDVNALGVASIIGLCNAAPDLDLPYVFGGDGATLLIPASRRNEAEKALRGVRKLAREAFDLGLRASIVPLSELGEAGHLARVARFRASPHTCLAMFSGSAFSAAEGWLKDKMRGFAYEVSEQGESEANFQGFECRWQPIVSQRGTTASLLVMALSPDEDERVDTYRAVLQKLESVVDTVLARPVKAEGLKFRGLSGDFSVEAKVVSKNSSGPNYDAAKRFARKKTFIGNVLTHVGLSAGGFDGAAYKSQLVENSDFRKFDETLRMVLDLSPDELGELRRHLERQRREGLLAYGIHEASSALITCLVRSYEGDHVHFVDGSDGGYALAAKQLKAQLSEWKGPRGPGSPGV